MRFKTSSGIKSIVGKDLITDPYVAIFELVKNSYDARAENVVVSFNTDSDLGPHIVIRDDGTGMSKDDIQDKWLYLAYSDKSEGQSIKGRVHVGSKGIGRFSSDRLGSKLELTTKVKVEGHENKLKVNWSDFEKSLSTRFEKVDLRYSSKVTQKKSSHYTQLLITDLRQEWDTDAINKALVLLRRLKNPFLVADGFNIYCGQDILDNDSSNIAKMESEHLVTSNVAEVLKDRAITVSATIGNTISIALFDRGKRIYELRKKNDTRLKDVKIDIEINYLTFSAKNMFSRRMGVQPVNFGNIFIYRNGFHVSPYGDKDYDLFGLNLRKGQGHSRYISTREIIGHISITDPDNRFRETSSRNNGFIDNAYLKFLEDFYMKLIHRALETYVILVKWGEISETETSIDWKSIDQSAAEKFKASVLRRAKIKGLENFSLVYFSEDLEFESSKKKKELERLVRDLPEKEARPIKDAIKQLKAMEFERESQIKEIEKQRKFIDNLERQNENLGARRSGTSYGEQVGHHLTSMASTLDRELKKLNRFKVKLDSKDQNDYVTSLHKVRRVQLELDQFKHLLIKSDVELRSAQSINWYEYAKWHFDNKRPSKKFQIICSIEDEEFSKFWLIDSKALEYVMMLENFYMNAKQHDGTYLEIIFGKNKIEFSSDTQEIDKGNLEKIFELGFTTKADGTGIGLHQIRSFLSKHGLTIEAQNKSDSVCFTVSK